MISFKIIKYMDEKNEYKTLLLILEDVEDIWKDIRKSIDDYHDNFENFLIAIDWIKKIFNVAFALSIVNVVLMVFVIFWLVFHK
jgi:hypothetical protein